MGKSFQPPNGQPSFHLDGFPIGASASDCARIYGKVWCVSLVYLSLFGFFFLTLTSSGGESLVLFFDLIELLHVVEELGASLQRNEKFGFLAVTS